MLYVYSSGMAFSNWAVISDTLGQPGLGVPGRGDVIGNTALLVATRKIGVNWQGVPLQRDVILGGPVLGRGGFPEPSTWAMMIIGFAGIGLTIRRRSHMTKNSTVVPAWRAFPATVGA